MRDPVSEALDLYSAGDPREPHNAEYDGVLRAADRAVSSGCATFLLYDVVWHVRFLRRDYDGALRDLQRALTLRPEAPSAYYHLGLVFESMGEAERARQSFLSAQVLAAAAGDEGMLDAIEHHI